MKRRKGFTLIELLIVIAIILSLSIVVSIKYLNVVESNNAKIDIINARVIAEGIKLAAISGDVDINQNISNQSINNKVFENYFDVNTTPKSKKYSDNSGFLYSIKEQKIIISANGLEIYPNVE